jgi:anti-anti-sigma factor
MPDSEQPRLAIEKSAEGLVLSGELDSHTAPILEAELARLDDQSDVTLDLSALSFIDSSGLRVIISSHQARSDRGERLVLAPISDAVRRLLEITSLTDHLNLA